MQGKGLSSCNICASPKVRAGTHNVRDSLKALNSDIWEGAQCCSKISVSVAVMPALLVQPPTVRNGLWICLAVVTGYFSVLS